MPDLLAWNVTNVDVGDEGSSITEAAPSGSGLLAGGQSNQEQSPIQVQPETITPGQILNGWFFRPGYMYSGTGANTCGMSPVDYPFWAGATYDNRASAPFRVTVAGALYATGATISGTITATAGTIGGWTIGATTITGGNVTMDSTGNIRFGKTGFSDTVNAGLIMGLNGATPTLYFGTALDASYMKLVGGLYDMVGTISSRSTLTIANAIDASGNLITDVVNARLNSSAKTILSDFNFGAVDYAGAVKSGTIAWNTTTGAITGGSGVVVYRGGIVGATAGLATFSLDATTGDATFKGQVTATTGYFLGGVSVGTGGTFYSGQTAFDTGVGWWMEYNGGSPRFSLGNSAGAKITFDSVNLVIAGGLIMNAATGTVSINQSATTGSSLSVIRNLPSASTDSPVVFFRNQNAGDDQPVLQIRQDSATATIPALYVESGRVGIGTLTPGAFLDIQAPSDVDYSPTTGVPNLAAIFQNATSGALNNVFIRLLTEASGEVYLGAVQNAGNTRSDFAMKLWSGTDRVERFRITSDGLVGIGMNPIRTLDVTSSIATATAMFRLQNAGASPSTYEVMRNDLVSGNVLTKHGNGYLWMDANGILRNNASSPSSSTNGQAMNNVQFIIDLIQNGAQSAVDGNALVQVSRKSSATSDNFYSMLEFAAISRSSKLIAGQKYSGVMPMRQSINASSLPVGTGCRGVTEHNGYVWLSVNSAGILMFRCGLDLTGATSVTFSGTTGEGLLAADDTNIFILTSTTNVRKYSVSGTTITYVSDITLDNAVSIGTTGSGFHWDGTSFYGYDGVTGLIRIFNSSGTQTSTITVANSAGLTNIRGLWVDNGLLWASFAMAEHADAGIRNVGQAICIPITLP